jgi:hypothetical protein
MSAIVGRKKVRGNRSYMEPKGQSNYLVNLTIVIWLSSIMIPFAVYFFQKNWGFIFLLAAFHILEKAIFKIVSWTTFFAWLKKSVLQDFKEKFSFRTKNYPRYIEKNRVLVAHFPHGLFCCSFIMNSDIFDNLRIGTFKILVFKYLMYVPVFGSLIKKYGAHSCDKRSMKEVMQRGENIMILPGGFNEIMMMENYVYNIYIPTGFISYCVKFNYQIIPVLNLGENEIYKVYPFSRFMWKFISTYIFKYVKFPLFFGYGKFLSFIPFDVPVLSLYGNVIDCNPKENENCRDAVSRIHGELQKSITELFEENIEEYCLEHGLKRQIFRLRILP